jgi:hypothetical protein
MLLIIDKISLKGGSVVNQKIIAIMERTFVRDDLFPAGKETAKIVAKDVAGDGYKNYEEKEGKGAAKKITRSEKPPGYLVQG